LGFRPVKISWSYASSSVLYLRGCFSNWGAPLSCQKELMPLTFNK